MFPFRSRPQPDLPVSIETRLKISTEIAMNELHPDLMPAPLRIYPKVPNRNLYPKIQVVRCHALAKLPSQPVFGNVNASERNTIRIKEACQCGTVPDSPIRSPVSSQKSSVNKAGSPSLDFSALFMKSPTLRQELERCKCQQRTTLSQLSPSFPYPELDRIETSSVESRNTSARSRQFQS